MAGHCDKTPNTRCYGCLSTNNERKLQIYYVKELVLKTLLQVDQLVLCCFCKKAAVLTEKFIHNVEISQALFFNATNVENSTFENYKTVIHPLVNLTCSFPNSEDTILVYSDAIKNESEIFSEHSTEIVEIKKEEVKSLEHDDYCQIGTVENGEPEKSGTNRSTKLYKCSKNETDLSADHDDYSKDLDEQNDETFQYPLSDKKQKQRQKDYCSQAWTLTRDELIEERAKKAKEKKYTDASFKCTNCIKGFVMKTPYENHMKLHDKNRGAFECDICKQILKTRNQLDHHYRYHVERYKCSKCDHTRNCWMSLKDHYLSKHSDGRLEYSCPVCFKQFRFRSTLQKHKQDKHLNRERMKCKYCVKTFASESALGYHLKFRHTEEESAKIKANTCTVCGRSFKLLQKLKNHLVTHSSRRDYYCVECDKSFKTRTALNLHFRTVMAHIGNKDQPQVVFTCPQCDKGFPQEKGLSRHIKSVHLNQTLLQCSQCGKTFKTKKSYRIHIISHEDGFQQRLPKKHCCSVCNKRFHEKAVLAKHMNTHTGEKPFQCSQCPAQFGHNGSLYNHVKLVHLNLTRKGVNHGTLGRKSRN